MVDLATPDQACDVAARLPLVSVIVPSFNQGKFIRRTLESILGQDYRPLEVIVIDGASTDETVSILREFQGAPELQWISEPDSGVVEAVNKGFARVRGEIAAIQSSDDFYLPGAVSAAVEALCAEPELAFVFGDIAKVDADGVFISRTNLPPFSLEAVLSLQTWIPQPSTFFRMPLARELGGWREEVPYAADTDLWLRMALVAPARRIPVLMAERSVHEAQRDTHGARIIRDYRRAIDTIAALGCATPRVRAAARAGHWLIANRYGPQRGLAQNWRLLRAAATYPELFRNYPLRAFIPGAAWLRAQASRLARSVGLR